MTGQGKPYVTHILVESVKELMQNEARQFVGVCIDYFDTLVSRSVSPEHTKRLAAKQLKTACGLSLSARSLYEIRSEIERMLCMKSAVSGMDAEFNLDDLATELYEVLKRLGQLPSSYDRELFRELFSAVEVAVEVNVQVVNKDLVDLLWWLKSNRISIYLVSDFYLPGESYLNMLKVHGLGNLFSELYISADYHLTKSSGRLYEELFRNHGYSPDQLIMIGDNLHSDQQVPVSKGMSAYLIDTSDQQIAYKLHEERNRSHRNRESLLISNLEECCRNIGPNYFPEMGMTLWLFTLKLFEHLMHDGVRNVFFCSKEGEFLKRLFDEYQQRAFGKSVIQSHYLLVSRKATFICSLAPLESERFDRLFSQYRDLSLDEFLQSLNFTHQQVLEICLDAEVDPSGRRPDLQSHEDFKAVLSSERFRILYESHREEQLNGFRGYLDSFGVDYRSEGLAMVDVGWKGSIQNNIYHALDSKVTLRGYYIGLLSPTGLSATNRKTGIIFSDYPAHSPYVHVYNNNRSLFEMLLGASHGSADGYFYVRDGFPPELDKAGRVMAPSAEGASFGVATLDLPEERKLYNKVIAPLQQAYLDMFTKATCLFIESEAERPGEEWFARQHSRMVFKPQKNEVQFFSRLYHLENFGLFEFTDFGTGRQVGFTERVNNLWKLLKAPAAYLETGVWPPIILMRLGLAFLQPIDGVKRQRRVFREEQ